jgi:hypothetical protein
MILLKVRMMEENLSAVEERCLSPGSGDILVAHDVSRGKNEGEKN